MGKNIAETTHCIFFCNGGSCTKKGADLITREVRAQIKSEGLHDSIHTIKTLCNGRCEDAPTIIVQPENVWYKNMTVEKGVNLINDHIKKGIAINENVLFKPGMENVATDNPLSPLPTKYFEKKEDIQLGCIEVALADAWEQNSYPLLKDLFQKFGSNIEFSTPENPLMGAINYPVEVSYEEGWAILKSEELELNFAIGGLSKQSPKKLREEKIGFVEVFKTKEREPKFGLRLRTKRGDWRLLVFFKENKEKIWNHINQIYLSLPKRLEDNVVQFS